MIILEDTEKYLYDGEFDDSYYYASDKYAYDEFGGWFKKIKKKITPKKILKGLFMPHTLIPKPHNIIKKKLLNKTPLGKMKSGLEDKAMAAIGFGKPRPRRIPRRTLIRPSQPIRRGGQANQRGGAFTPNYRTEAAMNTPPMDSTMNANPFGGRVAGPIQFTNLQPPSKAVEEQVKPAKEAEKPKKEGLSTIALVAIVAGGVGVLLGGAYLMTRNKGVVAPIAAPIAPAPAV